MWTRPFVEEPEELEELFSSRKKSYTRLTTVLFALSVVGFALQTVTVFYPTFRREMIYPAASWAFGSLLIAICRPITAPKSLLLLYTSIFATQAIIFVDGPSAPHPEDVLRILAITCALGVIGVILFMPMRHPYLPKRQISPAFGPATSELRSPEDDLTLWQFMTVSWMTPLMSVGNARQLNDEDVWKLSFEFQHRILHDTFRELKGSVLGRIFRANALDLVIMSGLSIFELVASTYPQALLFVYLITNFADFSSPVLLQKILQSMENPLAPKRAALNYAVLTLIIRLFAVQSGVFTLWFGRRAYERSRGEMITMLYEKTLSRKVISMSSKAIIEFSTDGTSNGGAKHAQQGRLDRTLEFLTKPFRLLCGRSKRATEVASNKPASMGKMLNIML
jgi:hypothetical protein